MKINLKGNTSQATTTGKNLLKNTNVNSGDNNFWGSYSTYDKETGTLTRSTTSTTESYIAHRFNLKNNTKYTISCLAKRNDYVSSFEIYAYNSTVSKVYYTMRPLTTSFKKVSFTFTTDSSTNYTNSTIRFDNNGSTQSGTEAILTIKDVMLVEGEDTEFEPYTNGASPNPDYPQDIHVVSGDNSINVCGKNLFEPTTKVNGTNIIVANGSVVLNDDEYTLTATGTDCYFGQVLSSGGSYTDNRGKLINVEGMSEITFTITNTLFKNNFITAYDSSKVSLGYTQFNSNTGTYTLPSNAKYITIRFGLTAVAGNSYSTKVQIEKGSTTSDFEQYIGNTYPVNLGVENYLPNNATTQTINGITYTINEDKSIKINGTARGRADIYLYGSNTDTGNYTYIPKGTYTIDTSNLLDGTMFLQFREKTAGVVYQTKQNNGLLTLLSQQDCYFYGIMLAVENGKTINNLTFYPQIEKGTKLNSYTPYGTTPIELCKIGNYQDSIKKSTGKNLFDKDNVTDGGFYVDRYMANASWCYVNTTELKAGQTYFTNQRAILSFFNGTTNISYVDKNNTSFIVPANTTNVYISTLKTNKDTLQLEKGTSHTPYEPYGTKWYVKKEIGKVVLNGSETFDGSDGNRWNYTPTLLPKLGSATSPNAMSNYYTSKFSTDNNSIYVSGVFQYISIMENRFSNVSDFKTWLSTHNTIVYYVLKTPTYTEITDSTLISQLNALAKSYASQTNISQESNDLASLLNANALEEM